MKNVIYIFVLIAVGLFFSCGETAKPDVNSRSVGGDGVAYWDIAYRQAGSWQGMTNISGPSLREVFITKSVVDSLLNDTSSEGFRLYMGYDAKAANRYRGIAVRTLPGEGGTQNDQVGGENEYFIVEPSSVPQSNILMQPVSQTCTNDNLPENEISWYCGTDWADGWKNATNINGGLIKGFFIHKRAYDKFLELSEDEDGFGNDLGIKIYFGIDSLGAYKTIDVNVDSAGIDKVPPTIADIPTTSFKAHDFAIPCPNLCGNANSLNNDGGE